VLLILHCSTPASFVFLIKLDLASGTEKALFMGECVNVFRRSQVALSPSQFYNRLSNQARWDMGLSQAVHQPIF
jgi:hypothetical protein